MCGGHTGGTRENTKEAAEQKRFGVKQLTLNPTLAITRWLLRFGFWGGRGGGTGVQRKGGGGDSGGISLENMHAIVAGVSNHDAPDAVDGNAAISEAELRVA